MHELQDALQYFRTTCFFHQGVILLLHQLESAWLYLLPHCFVFASFAHEYRFLQTVGSLFGYVSIAQPMKIQVMKIMIIERFYEIFIPIYYTKCKMLPHELGRQITD